MRIYGGHDYYDCGLSMGIDPTIVLVRGKSDNIPVRLAGGTLLGRTLRLKPEYSREQLAIGCVAVAFCGKVYRGALGMRGLEKPEGIWCAEKARAFAGLKKGGEIDVDRRWYDRRVQLTLEDYFVPTPASEALREYMIANKVSILVEKESMRGQETSFEVNPFTLKQIGFAKALDPYTAFQELSMWIGGVLGGSSPATVTITDDKVLAENHGFDKFSFRGPRVA